MMGADAIEYRGIQIQRVPDSYAAEVRFKTAVEARAYVDRHLKNGFDGWPIVLHSDREGQ